MYNLPQLQILINDLQILENKLVIYHTIYLCVCVCVILGCDRFCLFQWLSLGFVKIASFISSPQKTVAKIMCFFICSLHLLYRMRGFVHPHYMYE